MPFSKVFDQRYLNKTCKLESAIADVQKKIEQVKTDLETIESVCGKYKLNAKDIYVRKEYENAKGNGHMHTVVQPEMRALEVIPMHEDAKIAELMGSRK